MIEPLNPEKYLRPVIYQLMVRTFSNTREFCQLSGTLAQNGCGKFDEINHQALASLRQMGFTHVWLTGVFEQASCTAYPNRPADDSRIVKGQAGSPYAIRDYFNVSPDYAVDPEKRLEEFQDLIARCHEHGLRVIIDFVPNHVARSYQSTVRPESSLGLDDDCDGFFDRNNHFYYLTAESAGGGPPLKLPIAGQANADSVYRPEMKVGRVSGNNVISWAPAFHDWYETVKLNYGHDFSRGHDTSSLPGPDAVAAEVPKTWRTMDEILAFWQAMGVSGFRADMAHLVPLEFWKWALKRAHLRQPKVLFFAEAYDNDPAKLTTGNVLDELLKAGFDAVYDDPAYDLLEGIYTADQWANDLDALAFTGERFHRSLRYSENHDEVRLANLSQWGGHGMAVGRPVSAVLFALGRGPVMLYSGQEVGEPASHNWGFAGANARTSIFDYGSMPEFVKWVNHGNFDGVELSSAQQQLREWYGKMIRLTQSTAFTHGEFYGLNHANAANENYGRVAAETVSGHWLYSFLRYDFISGQAFLIVANFHHSEVLDPLRVIIPEQAVKSIQGDSSTTWQFTERLSAPWSSAVAARELSCSGVCLPALAPFGVMMLEITIR